MDKLNFNRYMKQIMLSEIGLKGQEKLKKAKVLVVGAGGLGCPVLQYLNAVGVGHLGCVDFDVVEESNLHRQVLFSPADIGKKKVDVIIEKLRIQNPETKLVGHVEKLSERNVDTILTGYDVVVDGSDNFTTRYLVNDACVRLNIALVYGSILDFQGQLALFNYKGSKNLRHLFPEPPPAEEVPSCSENGVLGTLPGIIGSMMAQETIKCIVDLKPLCNEWIVFDTIEYGIRKIRF